MSPSAAYPPYASLNRDSFASSTNEFLPNDSQGLTGGEYVDPQVSRAARRANQAGYGAGGAGGAAGAGALGYSDAGYPTDEWTPTALNTASSGKKKWVWGGVAAAVVIAVALGVGLGVALGTKHSSSSSKSASSSNSNSSSSNASSFDLDPRLHNSFWGIAYEPESIQLPDCGATQANVTRDIQLLSQLTTRIRLYGGNCNCSALTLQAIQDTQVNLSVYLAVYVDSNTQAITDQFNAIQDALKTYGTDHVLGITIGNEYLLNSEDVATATTDLINMIATDNTTIQAMNLGKDIPFGTSDAGSEMTTALAEGLPNGYFQANVHPWFGNVSIEDAADWTYSFFQTNDVEVANSVPNPPWCEIAETGWPTQSMDEASASDGPSIASVANLQTFLDTFVCAANANGTKYHFFEFRDAVWKAQYGGVEPYWGLFDDSTVLKNLTIPDCSHD